MFYVYIYLDPRKPGVYKYGDYSFDYEPFYVGKGKGDRQYAHIRISRELEKSNLYTIKSNKIRKIWNLGLHPIILRVVDGISDEDEAYAIEDKLIDLIGKLANHTGPLTNITKSKGGWSGKLNGMYGKGHLLRGDKNGARKASKNGTHWNNGSDGPWKGKKLSPEHVAKITDHLHTDTNPFRTYSKIHGSAFKGKTHSEESKKKLSSKRQAYFERIRNDPIEWAKFCERQKQTALKQKEKRKAKLATVEI